MANVVAKLGWKVFGGVSGLVAGLVTKRVVTTVWKRARGGQPPANPQQVDVSWGEAVAWTLASTAGVGVARLLAQRAAAGAWTKATGALPPGFDKPSGTDPEPARA